jgi:hypothetical protein
MKVVAERPQRAVGEVIPGLPQQVGEPRHAGDDRDPANGEHAQAGESVIAGVRIGWRVMPVSTAGFVRSIVSTGGSCAPQ